MKKLVYLTIGISIISCAPKYTASFQDYHVYNNSSTTLPGTLSEVNAVAAISNLPITELHASTNSTPQEFTGEMLSQKSKEVSRAEVNSRKKQARSTSIHSIKKITQNEPVKVGNPHKNWAAILGIVCSTLGLFVPMLFLPGIIFSAIGLKSEKKKLAMVGLIIGIAAFIVQLILFSIAYAEGTMFVSGVSTIF